MADNAKWYVVHTYSGYENAVKTAIEKFVANRHLEDMILDIQIPMETVTEVTESGAVKEVERKTFPRRFAGLAALAGLELRRHRRVFATTGSDDWGGGTHVFTFSKPEGA